MDGFQVMPMDEAAEIGDIFVTATGDKSVIAKRAHRADEGRRDPRQHGPLQRRDRDSGAARARDRDPAGARVRRGVHARRRPPGLPARRGAAGQPRRRRGASGAGDGHVLREPGALGRVRRPERRLARAEGLRRAEGDRRRDRPAQARDDGDRRSTSSPRSRRSTWPRGTRGPKPRSASFGSRPTRSSCSTSAGSRTRWSSSAASGGEVAEAIRTLAVRGAPAIGVAAAYGYALAAERGDDSTRPTVLAASRPTAVNLVWALEQMRGDPTAERARALHEEEVERCRRMAAHAAALFGRARAR